MLRRSLDHAMKVCLAQIRSEKGASVLDLGVRIGVAICYEIFVAAHADALVGAGAAVYLASVAKTPEGMAAARATLSETARRYGVPALAVNSVGTCVLLDPIGCG